MTLKDLCDVMWYDGRVYLVNDLLCDTIMEGTIERIRTVFAEELKG